MNFDEYKKKLELLDKEEFLLNKKLNTCFDEINEKRKALGLEYFRDNVPFEIEPGELISVKWYCPLGRKKSKYVNVPIALRYTIKKETYYTETFVFKEWKIDKYGVFVPSQCNTECRVGSGDYIVSVKKETGYSFCTSCDKYPDERCHACINYYVVDKEYKICGGFYRLINLDNSEKGEKQ